LPGGEKPTICIDLAIPNDFSEDFKFVDNIKLIDIPYLRSKAQGTIRQKFAEASKANQIVRKAVNDYLSGLVEKSLKPIFQDSFNDTKQMARQALDDLFTRDSLSMGEKEQDAVARMVMRLIGHASFQPAKVVSNRLVDAYADLKLGDVVLKLKEAV
jgi:glutamyl-tRNA reductase